MERSDWGIRVAHGCSDIFRRRVKRESEDSSEPAYKHLAPVSEAWEARFSVAQAPVVAEPLLDPAPKQVPRRAIQPETPPPPRAVAVPGGPRLTGAPRPRQTSPSLTAL